MIPFGDVTSDRLTFARPWAARWPGVAAFVAGVALMVAPRMAPALPLWVPPVLLAVGLLVAVAGLVAALWESRLDLNLRDGRYLSARGLPLLHRAVGGQASDFPRLVLVTRRTMDPYGGEGAVHTLSLEDSWRKVTLFRGYADDAARDIAYRVGARLGRVVEEKTLAVNEPDDAGLKTRRLTTGGLWMGFAGVTVVMFWPIISGARPLWRYPRRGGVAEAQSRGVMPTPVGGFRQGLDLYQEGRYQEAEDKFRQAAKARTKDPEPLNMLAYALAAQNRMDEALQTAKEAMALAPDSGIIIDTVAEMHERRGDLKLAAKFYDRALTFLPQGDNVETHAKYGRTLLGLGRKNEALEHLKTAAPMQMQPYGRVAYELLKQHFPEYFPSSLPSGTGSR
jgi:hypothetical protein